MSVRFKASNATYTPALTLQRSSSVKFVGQAAFSQQDPLYTQQPGYGVGDPVRTLTGNDVVSTLQGLAHEAGQCSHSDTERIALGYNEDAMQACKLTITRPPAMLCEALRNTTPGVLMAARQHDPALRIAVYSNSHVEKADEWLPVSNTGFQPPDINNDQPGSCAHVLTGVDLAVATSRCVLRNDACFAAFYRAIALFPACLCLLLLFVILVILHDCDGPKPDRSYM
eukprot:TRINITY_DN11652_c0_g1_i11.p3 TRINITY_DN11652_c0_g1~~TRINITY_DN11652_c0_g1_i11.p3  ORF type:complete len:227 (+),score=33.00 TRINITY_DN11652_c0_g1_i11:1667-2347(+)